jgi:hypothetical protein
MNRIMLSALTTILLFADVMVGLKDPRRVSEIIEDPRRFGNRRIQVVGYIARVYYLPHGARAILNIKLTDERLKPEDLKFGHYLLFREDGFNIGILRAIFEHLEVLQREGKRIVAEGRYDEDMHAIALYSLFLRYEIDERWERYQISTDKDDVCPMSLQKKECGGACN